MAYWPDTGTGVDTPPARKPVLSAVRKYFTEGGIGEPPTVPGGDWFNQMTNEVLNVLEAAGIEPDKEDDTQLHSAIVAVSNAYASHDALRRTFLLSGYNLRPFGESFELGGTLTSDSDVLLDRSSGIAFSGAGPFPQDVPPNTNPLSGSFTDRSDEQLKILGNMLVFHTTQSYTALVSDPSKWTGDVGTRLYLCPQEKVTSGTGGALKIFGDPYHKGGLSDYRDFGAYFSADQGGYTGYHGTGTFYLNSKISGLPTGEYFTKNPDIALTFQDGQSQAWRSVYLPSDANGPTRAVTVFGKQASTTAVNRGDISIELANKMGIDRFGGFAFWGEGNFSTVFEHRVGADGTDLLRFNYYNVPKLTFKWSGVDQGILADTRIVGRQATISQGGGNLSVSGFNSAYFTNTAARNISDFTDGVPGQEITLVFATAATTITHGPTIQLKGGVNFVATPGAVLKLIKADVWREVSRSS
ncbi:hypothetical protein LZ626_09965 [Aeromonas allosaccharophila]|uniref:hypothetical protein n=1 Tax=Aeromonas allosaccharophila TaxID=656 RepID=UPI001F2E0517|nr:hypothetical protein [Aeromonas allosaccharophila]MCE9848413.1 hypothetical protein [Aeromonas allosaccharophila]